MISVFMNHPQPLLPKLVPVLRRGDIGPNLKSRNGPPSPNLLIFFNLHTSIPTCRDHTCHHHSLLLVIQVGSCSVGRVIFYRKTGTRPILAGLRFLLFLVLENQFFLYRGVCYFFPKKVTKKRQTGQPRPSHKPSARARLIPAAPFPPLV
jgi:hypothetical protein